MATITAAATGNWSAGGTWNGGVPPGATDVGDANGFNVTLDQDITVQGIQATTGTFVIPASTTRTINGNVTYSGASTAGMIVVGTGQTLIVNGQVTEQTGAGFCIVGSGSGVLTVTNAGGTAVSCTGSGRAVSWNSSSALTIDATGGTAISEPAGSSGYAVVIIATCTNSITGIVTSNSVGGIALYILAGTTTLYGNIVGSGISVRITGGTFVWSPAASKTLAAGESSFVYLTAGTFTMNGVTLNNSGNFCVVKTGGTLNFVGTIIRNQSADAGAACTTNDAGEITAWNAARAAGNSPILPGVANVWYGAGQYGYAGGLLTPQGSSLRFQTMDGGMRG